MSYPNGVKNISSSWEIGPGWQTANEFTDIKADDSSESYYYYKKKPLVTAPVVNAPVKVDWSQDAVNSELLNHRLTVVINESRKLGLIKE
jgi:hypothetical protein